MIFLVHLDELQSPITGADLVDDGEVLRLEMIERRGLTGGVATVEIEIRNPGLVLLRQTGNVAVVEAPAPGSMAGARVLARARMFDVPEDNGGGTITLRLECAPSSWKALVRAQANNSVNGAGIPPYVVPVIPEPGLGTIALAFTSSPAAKWDTVKHTAVAVDAVFQDDLTRSPLSTLIPFTTLSIANALAILTIKDSAEARDAARLGKTALVAVSGDRDPSHGVPVTAGRVVAVRAAPFGAVDVIVNLADPYLAAAGITPRSVGDVTALGLPYFEPLFPGQRDDLTAAVLEGRSEVWHIDPVTHVISLDDFTLGQRLIDLGDLGDAASERRAVTTRPVQTVRMKVVAEFVQTAQGPCDIAMRVSRGSRDGVIRTLGNQATSFPSSSQGGDNNTGWSAQSPRVTVERYKSPAQFTGRAFEVTLRDHTMFYTPVEDPTSGKTVYQQSWAPGSPYTVTTYEKAQFAVTSVNYRNWIYTYSYSQTRREVVNLTLDVPNQPFALGESVLDLGVLQVSDVNSVEGVEPHQEGVAYNSGDRVLMRGKVYQCVGRNVTTFWRPNTVTRNGVATTTWTTPGWSSLGYGTPMGDPRNPSYFSTQRGRKTLEAAFCRMRAAALKRLGAIRVSKVFPWAVARDVTLRDSVRMLIRDGETIVPVKGKVEELKRTIDADGKAFVEVTITVCLGTGLNDEARPAPEAYVRTGYVSGVYAPGPGVAFGPSDTEGYIATGKAANDVEWALSSVRGIPKPIDAFKLADPQYSVLSVTVKNQADEQIGYARQLISAERDPRDVSQNYPTTLDVRMRPLRTEGNLIAQLLAHGRMTYSPRGIDMTDGGEP